MSLKELLKKHIPIIQAPMAGGITTPELVAAVSNAGAIGSFGFAYSSAVAVEENLLKARALTDKPINVNFFVFSTPDTPSETDIRAAVNKLNALPLEPDIRVVEMEPPFYPSLENQLEPIWKLRPEILTFHFGVPSERILEKAKSLGILTGITATSLNEAKKIQHSGADFIVVQGSEAGGHRGTFSADAKEDELLSTESLTKTVVENVDLPIVCAGGIMNASDISRMLSLGAIAVQMGTVFLCCDEAGTGKAYRQYLLGKKDRGTVFTKGFSGRWARAIENEFTSLMDGAPILDFPLQNTLTAGLRKKAADLSNAEYLSLWAGKGFRQVQSTSVTKLISELTSDL